MSGPDRIWAAESVGVYGGNVWYNRDDLGGDEYIRRDRDVIAALPEVQAIVDAAVRAEWEACAKIADDPYEYAPCEFPDQNKIAQGIAAAIRKRGEG